MNTILPPILTNRPRASRRARGRWYVAPAIVLVAWAVMFLLGRYWDGPINVVNNLTVGGIRWLIDKGEDAEPVIPLRDDPEYEMPAKESDRLDVLVLGIRGKDDEEHGGYLTDTILLLSIDERTGDASLVSIPRDLSVRITDTVSDKVNSAYLRLGLDATKRLFSRITGVFVDHAIVVDFDAFEAIVDELDGVTITLEQPFEESQQWGETFSLPAGEHTLTGEQALYYVRSRYSTSDFDRAWRQQQVILAIKDRIADIGLLQDPITAVKLANTLRTHIESDLNIFDISTLTRLAKLSTDADRITRYVMTTENLLYDTKTDGVYRLLPRGGTLAHIKAFMAQLPAPTRVPVIEESPAPASSEVSASL